MKTRRAGFGVPTFIAGLVPALVLVVAVAHSFQASGVRRNTSAAWASYVVGEIAESAIAEAGHVMRASDVFPQGGAEATFTDRFMQGVLAGRIPGADDDGQDVFSMLDASGQEVARMVVGVAFQPSERPIQLAGVARAVAQENHVKVDTLTVSVRPVTFRREFLSAAGRWINWGVIAFRARVKIEAGNGPVETDVTALKLYTLRPSGQPGDVVRFSERNLRTLVRQPGA